MGHKSRQPSYWSNANLPTHAHFRAYNDYFISNVDTLGTKTVRTNKNTFIYVIYL